MDSMETGNSTEMASIRTLGKVMEVSPKTIQDWIYKSRRNPGLDPLPFYKINGLVRFNLSEIRAWLQRRKVKIGTLDARVAA